MSDLGVCKFCGCDDENPCGIAVRHSDGELGYLPCAWLVEDVCTAPACVEKAYLEARQLAEDCMAIIAHIVQENNSARRAAR